MIAGFTIAILGVGFEIAKATEWGKRTLCLFRPSAGRPLSALIGGRERVTVRRYQSPADLPAILDQFFEA